MALDLLDILVLVGLVLGSAYFFREKLFGKSDKTAITGLGKNAAKAGKTRNIIERMQQSDKNVMWFYGSQTGTAEDYASRLSKEAGARFGLKSMTGDLEEYDFENLDEVPEDTVLAFVLATYGEGEPTDNAVEFYEFITGDEPMFSKGESVEEKPLRNLKYIAFGLGNNTYEHYNSMVRRVDAALQKLGATRIGTAGEGDDGAGTMEEDFLSWKETMWEAYKNDVGLEEREAVYEPAFQIKEREDLTPESDSVYLGEPNSFHLEGNAKGLPFNAHNPFIAPIDSSKELFTTKDRNCLHMEINLKGSNLSYTTGDHVAVWPTNPGREVLRLLTVLGIAEKKDTVINVSPADSTAKVPFPTPTTYDAILRYHIEICAPVSRQFLAQLAPFAPSDEAKAKIELLGSDKDEFHKQVANQYFNIAQTLEAVAPGQIWKNIPFSLILEGLTKIQPRYYSISSSSHVQKDVVAITAVVESITVPGGTHVLKGVTTNYLLALKQKQHGEEDPEPNGLNYNLTGPRNRYDGVHVPVHIRHSNFKLPTDPTKPIIMIGPGTGVAPFRAFVQERAALAQEGQEVGKTILFFGCRKESEDFLYADEWKQYQEALGDNFKLITAFSRDGPKKVYVQHRLEEHAAEVDELLKKGAYFYVCGDAAHMAREVNTALGRIVAEQRGLTIQQGDEIVKRLRSSNLYQEDVWS
ncbi:hypothetical protein BJ508DRAFT_19292 [Ascobolus immersus RN42]|uniref:NADPH--cytochrome P450 reductase n=1 Tax=Ascobolus immersus RN42 TaxID=1160509 RepID=A0A3N4HR38_ASCIM|nr:hypothetical protein BJ508DRAFT_19292 [Ascobolus immersus RN42]